VSEAGDWQLRQFLELIGSTPQPDVLNTEQNFEVARWGQEVTRTGGSNRPVRSRRSCPSSTTKPASLSPRKMPTKACNSRCMRSPQNRFGAQSLAVDFLQPGKQYCGRDRAQRCTTGRGEDPRAEGRGEHSCGTICRQTRLPVRLLPGIAIFCPATEKVILAPSKNPRRKLTSSAGSVPKNLGDAHRVPVVGLCWQVLSAFLLAFLLFAFSFWVAMDLFFPFPILFPWNLAQQTGVFLPAPT